MLDRALAADPGVEHQRFSWSQALFGRYDVIHFHWPETLFSASNRLNLLGKRAAFAVLLARLRLSRIAVVRTVHNLQLPTDVTRYQRRLLIGVERETTLRIRIGSTTELPEDQPSVLILHGDYRSWFADVPKQAARRGLLAFVGLVRRYKGVEDLIRAFRALPDDRVGLAVSGQPTSDALADEIRALADGDQRIELDLRFLDDADFVAAMTRAEVVVLPYRFMHNSGSVLAALSLDRPVLVPRNAANDALAAEVGAEWILSYEGDLSADDLAAASAQIAQHPPVGRPDLSRRSWGEVGLRHREAYAEAVRLRRGRR